MQCTLQLSAPANLLLLGEYAVTEENGLGVCCAVQDRAFARSTLGGSSIQIEGIWPQGGFKVDYPLVAGADLPYNLSLQAKPATTLPAICLQLCTQYLDSLSPTLCIPPLSVQLDSSAFFFEDGRKRGYGSSAVSTLLLCATFLEAAISENLADPATALTIRLALLQLAIQAHRQFQQGRSSGYDIAASLCGGLGLFRGGLQPTITRLPDAAFARFFKLVLIAGKQAVNSSQAIRQYQQWRAAQPDTCRLFLEQSNQQVQAFATAISNEDIPTCSRIFQQAAALGRQLGANIKVSADTGIAGAKALGAGNELGMLLCPVNQSTALPPQARRCTLAGQGLLYGKDETAWPICH